MWGAGAQAPAGRRGRRRRSAAARRRRPAASAIQVSIGAARAGRRTARISGSGWRRCQRGRRSWSASGTRRARPSAARRRPPSPSVPSAGSTGASHRPRGSMRATTACASVSASGESARRPGRGGLPAARRPWTRTARLGAVATRSRRRCRIEPGRAGAGSETIQPVRSVSVQLADRPVEVRGQRPGGGRRRRPGATKTVGLRSSGSVRLVDADRPPASGRPARTPGGSPSRRAPGAPAAPRVPRPVAGPHRPRPRRPPRSSSAAGGPRRACGRRRTRSSARRGARRCRPRPSRRR